MNTYLIFRNDGDSKTVAIVSVDDGENTRTERDLMNAITKAVTAWVSETEDGQNAWRRSSKDFNVGDLAECIGILTLTERLEKAGVRNLTIETHDTSEVGEWSYDRVLVDLEARNWSQFSLQAAFRGMEDEDGDVTCKFCHQPTTTKGEKGAHAHDGGWVCDGCWDERLRATE